MVLIIPSLAGERDSGCGWRSGPHTYGVRHFRRRPPHVWLRQTKPRGCPSPRPASRESRGGRSQDPRPPRL